MSKSTEACCSSGNCSTSRSWSARNGRVLAAASGIGRLGQHTLDPRPHLVLGRGGPGHPVLEVAEQRAPAVVEENQHELVLGPEHPVEGLGRQARLGQHLSQRRVDTAGALDQPVGGVHDAPDVVDIPGVSVSDAALERPTAPASRSFPAFPAFPLLAAHCSPTLRSPFSSGKVPVVDTGISVRGAGGDRTMNGELTIGDIFRNAARATPHRSAAALGDSTLTFAEIDEPPTARPGPCGASGSATATASWCGARRASTSSLCSPRSPRSGRSLPPSAPRWASTRPWRWRRRSHRLSSSSTAPTAKGARRWQAASTPPSPRSTDWQHSVGPPTTLRPSPARDITFRPWPAPRRRPTSAPRACANETPRSCSSRAAARGGPRERSSRTE